jgi:ADP-heptose:LPS heptosyltransferase
MLCAVPALRALRGTSPRAHITLIALPSARWLLDRFPTYFNELLPFPGFPGMAGGPAADAHEIVRFFNEAHERRIDLAIQLHDDGRAANAFTQLLGARSTAGAHPPDGPAPNRDFFIPWPTDAPEAIRLLRVLENLGAHPPRGADAEFPLTDADRDELAEALDAEPLERGAYVCLHPGPGPTERFVALGAAFAERGLRAALIGGGEHRAVAAAVADGLDPEVVDFSGTLTLGATAALLADAALLVGDGLSLAHVAAAVQTPSVAIAPEGADIDRWRPQDDERHRVLAADATPDDILSAAEELASATTPRAA